MSFRVLRVSAYESIQLERALHVSLTSDTSFISNCMKMNPRINPGVIRKLQCEIMCAMQVGSDACMGADLRGLRVISNGI